MGVFKVLLSRALHICSEKFLVQEIKFLINIFQKMGMVLPFQKESPNEYMNNITSVNYHGYRNLDQSYENNSKNLA